MKPMAMRGDLAAHETVITREGVWVGPNWVQLPTTTGTHSGILQRERELESLRQTLSGLDSEIGRTQSALDAAREAVMDQEAAEADLQEQAQALMAETTELKTALARHETALERQRERALAIRAELQTLEAQSSGGETEATALSAAITDLRRNLDDFDLRSESLVAARESIQEALDQARGAWREARETRHDTALQMEGLRLNRESLAVALQRNDQQLQTLVGRCTDLETAITSAVQPQASLRTQLDAALTVRIELESALGNARKTLEGFETDIRHNDEGRLQAERAVEEKRQVLDQARLEERAIEVRQQEMEQRLSKTSFTLETLLEALDEEADEATWAERLEKIRTRIERLGAINLAAIDEFAQLSERKEYLDKQHADLTEALTTLEGAIRKIDRKLARASKRRSTK